jgi:hypothetical protein
MAGAAGHLPHIWAENMHPLRSSWYFQRFANA